MKKLPIGLQTEPAHITAIIGGIPAVQSLKKEPLLIAPKTPYVKWYQFWSWHKIKRIRKQREQECINQFEEHFGEP